MSLPEAACPAWFAAFQFADSFFPSGLYTQSHGLESFIAAGLVPDPAALDALLQSFLLELAAPGDALAARWVARTSSDLDVVASIDTRLEATKLGHESRTVSRRCGGRVLALVASLDNDQRLTRYLERVRSGSAPGHQAVALALAGACAGLDEETVVAVELHSFAVSLLGAASRLGAIDHLQAQQLLYRAAPTLALAASVGRERNWTDMGGFAPQIDLMQFRHSRANARLFVS